MKRILLFIAALSMILTTIAQDNKPAPGKIGLGFSLSNGLGNRISFSKMLNGGLEAGLQLGINQTNTKSAQTDSVTVATDSGSKRGLQTVSSTNNSMSITLIPFILKHAELATNLDAFVGLQLPIIFGSGSKSTSNTKTFLTDFSREVNGITKQPSTYSFGVNLVFGCQWFFYENLGMGAICGLGFSSSGSKGDIDFTQTTSNSGSLNPSTTNSTINTLSIRDNKSSSLSTFNNTLGLFLSYYF